jgi:hypothetical protein
LHEHLSENSERTRPLQESHRRPPGFSRGADKGLGGEVTGKKMSLSLKDRIWFYLLGGKWPEENGYTVLNGFVSGGQLRCESFDGGEIWIDPVSYFNFVGFDKSFGTIGFRDSSFKDGIWLKNFKPFIWSDGKTYSVSPIQKKSLKGFLKCSPDAYFWWGMKKLQDSHTEIQYGKEVVVWEEGTEKGLYFRGVPSWRIDFPGTVLDGQNRHWIPSGGHFGTRYD